MLDRRNPVIRNLEMSCLRSACGVTCACGVTWKDGLRNVGLWEECGVDEDVLGEHKEEYIEMVWSYRG